MFIAAVWLRKLSTAVAEEESIEEPSFLASSIVLDDGTIAALLVCSGDISWLSSEI